MKKVRIYTKSWIPICVMVLMLFNTFWVHASEMKEEPGQIIFMIDGSQSMSEQHWQEAIDTVQMIFTMLPSDYETALLVYSDEVNACVGFGEDIETELRELKNFGQKGYTNTGVALETALQMFSGGDSGQKRVLIISDGEISMKGQEATEAALEGYNTAVDKALDRQVTIDVLLFETADVEDEITQGAETTNGFVYKKMGSGALSGFGETYLFEQLGIKRIMLGLSDSSDNTTQISLQDTYAERAKILLVSESAIKDIQGFCQSENLRITQGNQFAVIDIEKPMEEDVRLQYVLAERGRLSAYLVKEYSLSTDVETVYEENSARYAIKVDIADEEGRSILEDVDIRNKIGIYINGSKAAYEVDRGRAAITYPSETTQEVVLDVDFSDMNSLVVCKNKEVRLLLEAPIQPDEVDNLEYFWLYVVVAGVLVVFVLLLFLYIRSRQKKNSKSDTGTEPKAVQGIEKIMTYDFSGKIDIYVLKCPGMEDMPPASVNLFARKSKEPFSLAWVMDVCHMHVNVTDADKILFFGGEDHSLCVKNCGSATVSKGKDILLRDKKYKLFYNEKILLVLNDGNMEMELHYKNIKPSERER